jgi:hypothetical protein
MTAVTQQAQFARLLVLAKTIEDAYTMSVCASVSYEKGEESLKYVHRAVRLFDIARFTAGEEHFGKCQVFAYGSLSDRAELIRNIGVTARRLTAIATDRGLFCTSPSDLTGLFIRKGPAFVDRVCREVLAVFNGKEESK